MRVTLWGVRGSLPCPGPETMRYGGNTACVEVRAEDDTVLVLDAGTGIRRLGAALSPDLPRVDILLTHLHLDHIMGLGFFEPLHSSVTQVHVWGPQSATYSIRERLMRYLSPPLFPVHLRDLPGVHLHELPYEEITIGSFRVSATRVSHPGLTLGFRVATSCSRSIVAYMPDHEPALGSRTDQFDRTWTSGYTIAENADLLIHDAQYTCEEYPELIGWGHSTWKQAIEFSAIAKVKQLVAFHHDPRRNDADLEDLHHESASLRTDVPMVAAIEGTAFELT